MSDLRGIIVSHAAVAQALVTAVGAITGVQDALTGISNEGCGTAELGERLPCSRMREDSTACTRKSASYARSRCGRSFSSQARRPSRLPPWLAASQSRQKSGWSSAV